MKMNSIIYLKFLIGVFDQTLSIYDLPLILKIWKKQSLMLSSHGGLDR